MVEYKLDLFEKKPLEAHRNADGEIQFTETGDPLVDKWEEQIAKGEIPDLFEAFDEESLTHMQRLRQTQRDRDPYQGATIKDTVDKMQRILQGERPAGFKDMTPEKQRLLEEVFNHPTFGGTIDE
jgi:hypothetical protein